MYLAFREGPEGDYVVFPFTADDLPKLRAALAKMGGALPHEYEKNLLKAAEKVSDDSKSSLVLDERPARLGEPISADPKTTDTHQVTMISWKREPTPGQPPT